MIDHLDQRDLDWIHVSNVVSSSILKGRFVVVGSSHDCNNLDNKDASVTLVMACGDPCACACQPDVEAFHSNVGACMVRVVADIAKLRKRDCLDEILGDSEASSNSGYYSFAVAVEHVPSRGASKQIYQ